MVKKYVFIKENLNTLKLLSKCKLIHPSNFRNIELYEFYGSLCDKNKMDRYEKTASHFRIDSRQVMNIIKDLDSIMELPPNSKIVNISISQ